MIDCHTHTALCGHGQGTVAEYVTAARSVGLAGIAMTEHLPLPDHLDPGRCYAMAPGTLDSYVQEVRAAAASSPDTQLLLGIEADWLPGERDALTPFVRRHDPDVVLGSVHMLDGWAFDDPDLIDSWDSRDIGDVWRTYFDAVCSAAVSGLYDVMAHIDLVKKFGHRPAFDPTPVFADVAAALRDAGVAVEVSTAGLRKPCAEIYPSEPLLAQLARAGVPVTLASDAHHPSEVGYGFSEAIRLVRAAGYDRVVYFRARELKEVAL